MEQIIAGIITIWLGIDAIFFRKRIAARFNKNDPDSPGYKAKGESIIRIALIVGILTIIVGALLLTGIFDLPEG